MLPEVSMIAQTFTTLMCGFIAYRYAERLDKMLYEEEKSYDIKNNNEIERVAKANR